MLSSSGGRESYDMVVIGGGAGGLSAASGAAQLGASVALVEKKEALGGDCLFHGCVPSKALIEAGRLAWRAERASDFGIEIPKVNVDFPDVMEHVHNTIDTVGQHDRVDRFEEMGIDVYFGDGHFVSEREFEVGDVLLRGRKFVLATGAGPKIPPIKGLEDVDYLTNLTIFDLEQQPERLVILGGGPIGVEMGQAFSRLGSEVVILESTDYLLRRDDHELCAILNDTFREEGIELYLEHRAVGARERDDGTIEVPASDPEGKETFLEGDTLLVSLGRSPNLEGLGLEAAGIEYTKRGIEVDSRLRTSQHHIYAIGDCNGGYQFTHVAEYEAGVVVSNALYGAPMHADYSVVPWTTFCDPEMAHVGLTEEEAREKGGDDLSIYRYKLEESDRAIIDQRTEGMVKLICSGKEIVGAHILGEAAGQLLHEFVLLMSAGRPVTDISSAIHVYPSISQAVRRAANQYYEEHLFESRTAHLLKKLFNLRGVGRYQKKTVNKEE